MAAADLAVAADPADQAGSLARAGARLDLYRPDGPLAEPDAVSLTDVLADLDAALTINDNLHHALSRVRYLTATGNHRQALAAGTEVYLRWPGREAARTVRAAAAAAGDPAAAVEVIRPEHAGDASPAPMRGPAPEGPRYFAAGLCPTLSAS